MEQKKVGIVVVTHNRLELLKEAIASIRQQTFKDFDIVVVNNGSTDGTTDWLNGQEDVITITQENLGGAGGFHFGMRYVAEHGYGYCWVMDDDVVCSPTTLEELMKAILVREDIGFVCSRVLGVDGRPMNTPLPAVKSMNEDSYSDVFELVNMHAMVRLDCATFVSVLLPSKIIFKVGLPYKEFFIWYDDFEYTSRISRLYPSYVACRSEVVHKRLLQGPLSFYKESDTNRLKNYFYYYRNLAFSRIKLDGARGGVMQIGSALVVLTKLLVKLDWRKILIFAKSQFALLFFHPKVEFPRGMTELRNDGFTEGRRRSRFKDRDEGFKDRDEGLKPAMRRAGMKGDVYYETNV